MANCLHEKYDFKTTKCPQCAKKFTFADVIQMLYGHIRRIEHRPVSVGISAPADNLITEFAEEISKIDAHIEYFETVIEEMAEQFEKRLEALEARLGLSAEYPPEQTAEMGNACEKPQKHLTAAGDEFHTDIMLNSLDHELEHYGVVKLENEKKEAEEQAQ